MIKPTLFAAAAIAAITVASPASANVQNTFTWSTGAPFIDTRFSGSTSFCVLTSIGGTFAGRQDGIELWIDHGTGDWFLGGWSSGDFVTATAQCYGDVFRDAAGKEWPFQIYETDHFTDNAVPQFLTPSQGDFCWLAGVSGDIRSASQQVGISPSHDTFWWANVSGVSELWEHVACLAFSAHQTVNFVPHSATSVYAIDAINSAATLPSLDICALEGVSGVDSGFSSDSALASITSVMVPTPYGPMAIPIAVSNGPGADVSCVGLTLEGP